MPRGHGNRPEIIRRRQHRQRSGRLREARVKVAIAGNPNCGKTSIFNRLTGTHQHVGNYPGVTVEKRSANVRWEGLDIELVDLPGTYGLSAITLDEKVARDYILRERPDVVINVVDAGNLQRNLYLTTQLLEMGIDVVLDLNMWDEAKKNGVVVDSLALSKLLGTPVVRTVANRGIGIGRLMLQTVDLIQHRQQHHRHPPVTYGQMVDDKVADIALLMSEACSDTLPTRWYATHLLQGTITADELDGLTSEEKEKLEKLIETSRDHIEKTTGKDIQSALSEGRYAFVNGLLRVVAKPGEGDRMASSNKIDNIITHRWFGYPIFLAIMWLIFQGTYVLGQYPADWINQVIGLIARLLVAHLPAGFVTDLLVEGVIGGVGSVLVFLPNILILFLGIALLEDSGYMSRAAFIMDRLMRAIGLQGKSFIPMLMGFGCNVPAIMATRTLEEHRDRVLTTLLVPYMSCSARLPVYVLFAGAFFAERAGTIIFLMYLFGVAVAVFLARIFKMTVIRGKAAPFVMELPPYRIPTARAAVIHMWERGKIYLKKMGGVILIASVVLWFLGAFPRVGEYSQNYDGQIAALEQQGGERSAELIAELQVAKEYENVTNSYIGRLGRVLVPVVAPIGFDWQMGVCLVTGFVAKEVVISSMGVLYQLGEDVTEESTSLIAALQNPKNGITPMAAFAFMIFVLLYTPCITVVIAIRREIGIRWMWFSVASQLAIAWLISFAIYRIGLLLGF